MRPMVQCTTLSTTSKVDRKASNTLAGRLASRDASSWFAAPAHLRLPAVCVLVVPTKLQNWNIQYPHPQHLGTRVLIRVNTPYYHTPARTAVFPAAVVLMLTIRLQLNPNFDRGFPRSKSLILTNMRITHVRVLSYR